MSIGLFEWVCCHIKTARNHTKVKVCVPSSVGEGGSKGDC